MSIFRNAEAAQKEAIKRTKKTNQQHYITKTGDQYFITPVRPTLLEESGGKNLITEFRNFMRNKKKNNKLESDFWDAVSSELTKSLSKEETEKEIIKYKEVVGEALYAIYSSSPKDVAEDIIQSKEK